MKTILNSKNSTNLLCNFPTKFLNYIFLNKKKNKLEKEEKNQCEKKNVRAYTKVDQDREKYAISRDEIERKKA